MLSTQTKSRSLATSLTKRHRLRELEEKLRAYFPLINFLFIKSVLRKRFSWNKRYLNSVNALCHKSGLKTEDPFVLFYFESQCIRKDFQH